MKKRQKDKVSMNAGAKGIGKVSGWNWEKILTSATLGLIAAGLVTLATRRGGFAGDSEEGTDANTAAAGTTNTDTDQPRSSAVEDQTLETSMPTPDVPFMNEEDPLRTGTSKRQGPGVEGTMGIP